MLAGFVFWQLRAPYPLMNMRLYSYRSSRPAPSWRS
jgi:hypothetical protein